MLRVAVVAALMVLTACASESDDPRPEASPPARAGDAVKDLLTSLEAGDCDQVKRLVVTPDAIDCEQIEDLAGSYADDGIDLDDMTVTQGETVDGSTSVTVDLGPDAPDETWQVEKVAGSWRVLFDSLD